MTSEPATYPGYRFPAEIISHAVWLYHAFGLSLRPTSGRSCSLARSVL
jgi:putative transposase